jgi:3-methyladenine DNA glycosylase AlkC
MAAFKHQVGPELAAQLARELAGAWPEFPRRRFTRNLAVELGPLELLARVDLLADRLARSLPARFEDSAPVLWRALDSASFTGWMTLPCGTYVARQGLDDPEIALPLLAGLTPRWSSEAPIRPFIERHPDLTYRHLREWVRDPDEHVRRLVSEGTRPRLPWAPQLRGLIEDPTPNLDLLGALVDDPSDYVRRSVGNHLNDISKDHPDLAVELARRWLPRSDRAAWAVRHGLRTLIKRGDVRALTLLDVETDAVISLASFASRSARIAIGETAELVFTLVLDHRHPTPVDAVIDYRVHYVGARGTNAPKVFKLTRRRLEPGRPQTIERRHRFEHVSIRQIRPGPHVIDLQVNGRVLGSVTIHLDN